MVKRNQVDLSLSVYDLIVLTIAMGFMNGIVHLFVPIVLVVFFGLLEDHKN